MTRVLTLLMFSGLFACSPAVLPEDSSNNALKSTGQLMQEINAESKGSCTQNSDCMTTGVGSKSCGGPESYIAFSKWDSIPSIFDLVYNYNLKRKDENSGSVGTCEYLMSPSVSCVSNVCKKQSSTTTAKTDVNTITLSIFTGTLTLAASNVEDAVSLTFKTEGSVNSQFVKTSDLDLATKNKIEKYRNSNASVTIKVRVFARYVQAAACEFSLASCSSKVSAIDIKALKILQ